MLYWALLGLRESLPFHVIKQSGPMNRKPGTSQSFPQCRNHGTDETVREPGAQRNPLDAGSVNRHVLRFDVVGGVHIDQPQLILTFIRVPLHKRKLLHIGANPFRFFEFSVSDNAPTYALQLSLPE